MLRYLRAAVNRNLAIFAEILSELGDSRWLPRPRHAKTRVLTTSGANKRIEAPRCVATKIAQNRRVRTQRRLSRASLYASASNLSIIRKIAGDKFDQIRFVAIRT